MGEYILMESDNEMRDEIYHCDCMGKALTEEGAMRWRDENPTCRYYKYCPDVTWDINKDGSLTKNRNGKPVAIGR